MKGRRSCCSCCREADGSPGNGARVKVANDERMVREKRIPLATTVMVDDDAEWSEYSMHWVVVVEVSGRF